MHSDANNRPIILIMMVMIIIIIIINFSPSIVRYEFIQLIARNNASNE